MSMFEERIKVHDKIENMVMDIVRPFTDRRHLPDRRVSFGGVPVSFDIKSNVFVEKNSRDEYFRLLSEGEPVAIVYRDKQSGKVFADWIDRLSWSGPFPPSFKSTSGDPYYRISGGRTLHEWLNAASSEARDISK